MRPDATLALVLAAAPLAAQQRAPAAPQWYAVGIVVADSGGPVAGAEVLAPLGRAVTDAGGRFRLELGSRNRQTILIRRIGFLPQAVEVEPVAEATDLGRIVLEVAPAVLPEIEVEGRLPSPGFSLGFGVNLDQGSTDGPGLVYAPHGAAMTGDGVFVVQLIRRFGRPDSLMVTRYRNPRMAYGGWGFGAVCNRRRFRTLATRIGNLTHTNVKLLLDANGGLWDGRGSDCKNLGRFDLPGRLLAAAPRPRGWAVAVAPNSGPALVLEVSDGGRELWRKPLADLVGAEAAARGVLLSPTSRGVAVAATSSPFTWAEVDSTGRVRVKSSPLAGHGGQRLFPEGIPKGWIAYPVLEVPDGYIQSLESERGRDGKLVVYDLLGRPHRTMGRSGFSVLIASLPEERLVLGWHYRGPSRANGAHLFVYFY